MKRLGWMALFLALAGCAESESRAGESGVERVSSYTRLDDKNCGPEQVIEETGAGEIWVTHGREEALVRWCELEGIAARPLHLVGYEDEAGE